MSFSVFFGRPGHLVCVLICGSVWLCSQLPIRAEQSARLAWDAAGDPQVAGYRIYYGGKSQIYTNSIDVGLVTEATITGLSAGETYYFAATTYYDSGDESDYSNETAFSVPATASPPPGPSLAATSTIVTNPATLAATSQSGGNFHFTVAGATGLIYILQASSDLVNWVPVQTNAAPFVFVENNTGLPRQFYRAVGAMTTVPVAAMLNSTAPSDGQIAFDVTGTPGFKYIVEASTDMVNWVPMQTNTAPFAFVDTNLDWSHQFYRAIGEAVVTVPVDGLK